MALVLLLRYYLGFPSSLVIKDGGWHRDKLERYSGRIKARISTYSRMPNRDHEFQKEIILTEENL